MIHSEAGNQAETSHTATAEQAALKLQQRLASPRGEQLRSWLSNDLVRLEEQFASFITPSSLKRSGRSGAQEERSAETAE